MSQLLQQIKQIIVKELTYSKFKKAQLANLHARIYGFDRPGRKNELADAIGQKIITLIRDRAQHLQTQLTHQHQIKQKLIDFIQQTLQSMNLNELKRPISKKIIEQYTQQHLEQLPSLSLNKPVKPGQEPIHNIWSEENQTYLQCLCPKPPSNLTEAKRTAHCYSCKTQYHVDCFWSPQKDEVPQCPFCYVIKYHPTKATKKILFAGYLPMLKKDKVEYRINFNVEYELKADKNIIIEARCVKFNSKNKYEIAWPDNCHIYHGKYKIHDLKPLMNNSPLKRRNDEPIRLEKSKLTKQNELMIEERNTNDQHYRVCKKSNHLVIIIAYKELTREEVINQMKNNTITVENSQHVLKTILEKGSQELMIEKLAVSLRCQFYGNRMNFPIRSRLCTTHYQPFDLVSYVNSSFFTKTSTKKWKCPICNKRAYDVVIDEYILELMHKNTKAMEITFKNNALPEMIEKSSEEEEPSQSCHKAPQKLQKIPECSFIDLEESEENQQMRKNNITEIKKQLTALVQLQDKQQHQMISQGVSSPKRPEPILEREREQVRKRRKQVEEEPAKIQVVEIISDEEDDKPIKSDNVVQRRKQGNESSIPICIEIESDSSQETEQKLIKLKQEQLLHYLRVFRKHESTRAITPKDIQVFEEIYDYAMQD